MQKNSFFKNIYLIIKNGGYHSYFLVGPPLPVKKVREILVMENHEIGLEEGKNNKIEWIIQELSNEQEKIDSFSRSMSNGLNLDSIETAYVVLDSTQ